MFKRLGFCARANVELRDFLAVGANEARGERLAGFGFQMRDQRPIFTRHEFFDFKFAVADQSQRHGLHASRGARARQFAPQHRRQIEADEIIERATGEIGVDQRLIDLARMRHRLLDRVLGDGVKDDAFDLLVLEDALLVENVEQMPGDGFAFAIRIGGENDLVGALDGVGDGGDALGALGVHLPEHREIIVGVDGAILGRQIADMAVAGDHIEIAPQIFIDGLRFGRRLDDYDIHNVLLPKRDTRQTRRPDPAGGG